jgi:putative ABC transport system permease protein
MNPGEIVRTALSEIRHHKMRSVLTLMGIILGTLSITVMTSFLDGVEQTLWQGFADLGFDGVMYVTDREARDLRESEIFTRSTGLQPRDAEVVLARGKTVSAVAPVIYDEQIVRRGGVERKARVMGVTPGYAVIRGRKLESGRFLDEYDDDTFARVCVLGHRLNLRLFGTEDPIGKSVTVDGRSFRVVGVGQKLGNVFFNDRDFVEEMEGIYLPLSTLRKFYTGEEQPLTFLAVKTNDLERLGDLKSEVISSLKIAHRGAQDFKVENIAEEIVRSRAGVKTVIQNWRIVLGSIAGISLLVGGIGLLSVMLISIGERVYEIGLRKAIGAGDLQVFVQFLMESVVLSLIGALLGAAAGVGITKAAAGFFPSGLPINMGGLAFAIGIAIALGVLFGIYPALKACRMAPVEALRSAA